MSPTKKKKIELWMSLYISWLLDWAVIDTTLLKGEGPTLPPYIHALSSQSRGKLVH